jgi:hypothetical protein
MLIVLYVLGCFAFMLCMIGGILVAFYSMARGLWSGALIGGIGAIFAMIAMVDCVITRSFASLPIGQAFIMRKCPRLAS